MKIHAISAGNSIYDLKYLFTAFIPVITENQTERIKPSAHIHSNTIGKIPERLIAAAASSLILSVRRMLKKQKMNVHERRFITVLISSGLQSYHSPASYSRKSNYGDDNRATKRTRTNFGNSPQISLECSVCTVFFFFPFQTCNERKCE